MTWHVGRSLTGHQIEDDCPCEQAPCGLAIEGSADPPCPHHSLAAAKTLRQGHLAEHCPGKDPA